MSAPIITVDSNGIAQWTMGTVQPAYWIIEICYPDGSTSNYFRYNVYIDGASTSFDVYSLYWNGGLNLALIGLDSNSNVILGRSLSSNLTKNQ
jgi:hypothetical protein